MAPDQLGPEKVETGIKETWLPDEHHCPRPGPRSVRSRGCQGPFPSSLVDESARRELQLLEEQLCDQKNINLCLLNAEHL